VTVPENLCFIQRQQCGGREGESRIPRTRVFSIPLLPERVKILSLLARRPRAQERCLTRFPGAEQRTETNRPDTEEISYNPVQTKIATNWQAPAISNKPKVVASYLETVENKTVEDEATANEAAAEDETTACR
jgi:hypothetical protein